MSKTQFSKFVLLALLLGCWTAGLSAQPVVSPEHVTYTQWEALPSSPLKTELSNQGCKLINNFNVVQLQDGKPTLFRGGGFTQANIDWLVKEMGVRTILDLRGRFSDDKTDQLVVHSDSLLAEYKQKKQLDKLKNMSPDKVAQYVQLLNQRDHIPVQYHAILATDPGVLTYLNNASPNQPVAMFCQWGVNRSGTAWGTFAAQQGWSFTEALKQFGVKNKDGSYRNQKDISYGYEIQRHRMQKRAGH